jgi:hypothetical protein
MKPAVLGFARRPPNGCGGLVTRSTTVKLALVRGLEALEAQYK